MPVDATQWDSIRNVAHGFDMGLRSRAQADEEQTSALRRNLLSTQIGMQDLVLGQENEFLAHDTPELVARGKMIQDAKTADEVANVPAPDLHTQKGRDAWDKIVSTSNTRVNATDLNATHRANINTLIAKKRSLEPEDLAVLQDMEDPSKPIDKQGPGYVKFLFGASARAEEKRTKDALALKTAGATAAAQSRETVAAINADSRENVAALNATTQIERDALKYDAAAQKEVSSMGKDITFRRFLSPMMKNLSDFKVKNEKGKMVDATAEQKVEEAQRLYDKYSPATSAADSGTVLVVSPSGVRGMIPAANLEKALKSGYKRAN